MEIRPTFVLMVLTWKCTLLQEIAPLAKQAAETVVLAVDFEGLESLISELLRGLGDAQVHPWADCTLTYYDYYCISLLLLLGHNTFKIQVFLNMNEILQAAVRRGSADLVGFLFKNTKLDVEDEIPNLLSTLIIMLTDTDPRTVQVS